MVHHKINKHNINLILVHKNLLARIICLKPKHQHNNQFIQMLFNILNNLNTAQFLNPHIHRIHITTSLLVKLNMLYICVKRIHNKNYHIFVLIAGYQFVPNAQSMALIDSIKFKPLENR